MRLDVYVKDSKETVYDIEMQAVNTKELPKRARYYQSMIDLQMLDKGLHYKYLKPCYIIFICPFDAFQKGRHIYNFENSCKEEKSLALEDGVTKIFLNADSELDDVRPELKVFLDYVAGIHSEDAFIKQLEQAVEKAKKNRRWRHEYMTLLMRDQENLEKGRIEGRREGKREGKIEGEAIGIKNTLSLIQKLMENGRLDEIEKIQEDKEYCEKLFREYHILNE